MNGFGDYLLGDFKITNRPTYTMPSHTPDNSCRPPSGSVSRPVFAEAHLSYRFVSGHHQPLRSVRSGFDLAHRAPK
jgi:hypothetical protein